jgi:hypothetical protein
MKPAEIKPEPYSYRRQGDDLVATLRYSRPVDDHAVEQEVYELRLLGCADRHPESIEELVAIYMVFIMGGDYDEQEFLGVFAEEMQLCELTLISSTREILDTE